MFETSNPEVLLLYSYFAPHVRRLVWAFFPFKQNDHSTAFDNTTSIADSKSTHSTSASQISPISESSLGQSRSPLTATTSEKQKLDRPGKKRKSQGPKLAVNEPLQSGRLHRINLLVVATAIIVGVKLAYNLVNISGVPLTRLLRTLTGHRHGAPRPRILIFPILRALVRVCLSFMLAASGMLLLSLIALLLSASVLPTLFVMHYFRLEMNIGSVTLRCN